MKHNRKLKDTDYLYISARVRALETRLFGREKTERLADAKSAAEVISAIGDTGTELKYNGENFDIEATLDGYINEAYKEVQEGCPAGVSFDYLRYSYDCNNLKAAIKEELSHSHDDGAYYSCGTLPAERARSAQRTGDYSVFPEHMKKAAEEAVGSYYKRKDPSIIDLMLDSACYADMFEACFDKFTKSVLGVRCDIANILSCARIISDSIPQNEKLSLMNTAYIKGGKLDSGIFAESIEAGIEKLVDSLSSTDYYTIGKALSDGISPAEQAADTYYAERLRDSRFTPFGAEVCSCYLLGLEISVKNLRIVYGGKVVGYSSDKIRERLRKSYV